MTTKIDKPTVRQAAELMPPGPDRDALFARAREFFNQGHGPFLEKRIAGVQRALEMIWAAHEAQQLAQAGLDGRKAGAAEPPRSAREHLRYENQLDRPTRSHDPLWEQAFKLAREAIFQQSRKRLATPVYEVDEHWDELDERLNHDAWYALHRPKLEADYKTAARPAPVVQKAAAAPLTAGSVRELAKGIDRMLQEVKAERPKPVGSA